MHRLIPLLLCIWTLHGESRQVAITFDDLPRGGDSREERDLDSIRRLNTKLLTALKKVPVIGFVNAGGDAAAELGDAGLQEILRIWHKHGAALGNHTYSHRDINRTSLEDYTADIVKGEPAIVKATGRKPVFFRHPFLHAGKDPATKRGLEQFLDSRGYRIAPVTLDNSDYVFAFVYANALKDDTELAEQVRAAYLSYMESIFAFFESRSLEVVGRSFPQILLLHVNRLNADAMPELVRMMQKRGYEFVSLETALRDPAYRLADDYAGPSGFSWIHRWSKTKGMPPKGEPDPPARITELFQKYQKRGPTQ